MTESKEIEARIRDFAQWLSTVRVSQSGWAKVVERISVDAADTALAIEQGKIVAHIPAHLKNKTKDYV